MYDYSTPDAPEETQDAGVDMVPDTAHMGGGDGVAALQSSPPTQLPDATPDAVLDNPYAAECTQNWDVLPVAKYPGYRRYECTYDGGACKFATMTKNDDTTKIENHIQQHRLMREAERKREQSATRMHYPAAAGAGIVRSNGRPL